MARDRVKAFIEGWLGGTNPNKLLYEDTWGGVCTLLKVEQTGDMISVIGHMHKSAIGIFEPNKCSSNIY